LRLKLIMGNTLDHLLKVEAEAAALVSDAQTEADRRIHENEDRNRVAYEERLKAEAVSHRLSLEKEKDIIKNQYKAAFDAFKKKISNVNVNEESFFELFNQYLYSKDNRNNER